MSALPSLAHSSLALRARFLECACGSACRVRVRSHYGRYILHINRTPTPKKTAHIFRLMVQEVSLAWYIVTVFEAFGLDVILVVIGKYMVYNLLCCC